MDPAFTHCRDGASWLSREGIVGEKDTTVPWRNVSIDHNDISQHRYDMALEVRSADSYADVVTMLGPQRPDANVCWCSAELSERRKGGVPSFYPTNALTRALDASCAANENECRQTVSLGSRRLCLQ